NESTTQVALACVGMTCPISTRATLLLNSMTRVPIAVQPRPYQAIIQNGLLEQAGSSLHDLLGSNKKLFVVTVPPVRKRWGKKLMDSLSRAGFAAKIAT